MASIEPGRSWLPDTPADARVTEHTDDFPTLPHRVCTSRVLLSVKTVPASALLFHDT